MSLSISTRYIILSVMSCLALIIFPCIHCACILSFTLPCKSPPLFIAEYEINLCGHCTNLVAVTVIENCGRQFAAVSCATRNEKKTECFKVACIEAMEPCTCLMLLFST